MSKRLIIGVDVDEVVAQLHAAWLRRYNALYNDTLTVGDFTSWDIQTIVKPECGTRIFDILREPGFYNTVEPYPFQRNAVQQLRERGHRVIFVTACAPGTVEAKWEWLKSCDFVHDLKDFFPVRDKSLVAADILIDDHIANVEAFPRMAYLVNRPHNLLAHTTVPRVQSLADAAWHILGWSR